MKKPKIIAVKTEKRWLPVPGFPMYDVDRYGNMRSHWYFGTVRPDISREIRAFTHRHNKSKNPRRTLYVKLTDAERKTHELPLAHIVARTWFKNIPEDYVIYHKNGIVDENNIYNIGFCPRKELGKKFGNKIVSGKTASRSVVKVDRDGNHIEYYRSMREAGRQNYVSYQTVSDRCYRRIKHDEYELLGGYTFRLEERARGGRE